MELQPEARKVNRFFKNNKNLTFSKFELDKELNIPSFFYGAAYADLDKDGDLDFVVNNVNEYAFIYENNTNANSENNYLRIQLKGNTPNNLGFGTKIEIHYGDTKQYQDFTITRGYQSSMEPIVHFGIGSQQKIDKLIVTWPDETQQVLKNIEANQVLTLSQKDAGAKTEEIIEEKKLFKEFYLTNNNISYEHKEIPFDDFERELLLPHRMSRFGPKIAVGDVNGESARRFLHRRSTPTIWISIPANEQWVST